MNPVKRTELFAVLFQLSETFPEWRFGQLFANVATAANGPQVEAIWDSEDDELLAAARRLLDQNRERLPIPTPSTVVPNLTSPDAAARA